MKSKIKWVLGVFVSLSTFSQAQEFLIGAPELKIECTNRSTDMVFDCSYVIHIESYTDTIFAIGVIGGINPVYPSDHVLLSFQIPQYKLEASLDNLQTMKIKFEHGNSCHQDLEWRLELIDTMGYSYLSTKMIPKNRNKNLFEEKDYFINMTKVDN